MLLEYHAARLEKCLMTDAATALDNRESICYSIASRIFVRSLKGNEISFS